MKIYVKIENDPDPEPSDADPYRTVAICCVPCCRMADDLWKEKTAGYTVTFGSCGGGPSFYCEDQRLSLSYQYCMFCGAKVVQESPSVLPPGLAWEPIMVEGEPLFSWLTRIRRAYKKLESEPKFKSGEQVYCRIGRRDGKTVLAQAEIVEPPGSETNKYRLRLVGYQPIVRADTIDVVSKEAALAENLSEGTRVDVPFEDLRVGQLTVESC